MNQKDFAKKIIKCSQAHWSKVLNCKGQLGYSKAELVARVLNTSVTLWINPEAKSSDRWAAWNNFNS